MNHLLGKTVKDRITGFKGVVVGYVEYISGCNQVLIVPRVKEDGSTINSGWYDEQRIDIDVSASQIVLDNSRTPGSDKAPPIR